MKWGYFAYDHDSNLYLARVNDYATAGAAQHDLNEYWHELQCDLPATVKCDIYCYTENSEDPINIKVEL